MPPMSLLSKLEEIVEPCTNYTLLAVSSLQFFIGCIFRIKEGEFNNLIRLYLSNNKTINAL